VFSFTLIINFKSKRNVSYYYSYFTQLCCNTLIPEMLCHLLYGIITAAAFTIKTSDK